MNCWSRKIEQINNCIIHVQYVKTEKEKKSNLINGNIQKSMLDEKLYICDEKKIYFGKNEICLKEVSCKFEQVETYKYEVEGEPIYEQVESANGSVTILKNGVKNFDKYMHKIELEFESLPNEMLCGLGQHEDGIYNYKGRSEYLYQNNMKIAIPFIMSTNNYGILIDTESNLLFESTDTKISFIVDAEEKLSYYVILGNNFDEIIYNLRELTGTASMLPRWAFGYIQSKEKYNSASELIEIGERFRKENIPIDCLVQDWCTWEEKKWGQKTVDKIRYPNLPEMMKKLHDMNIKLMVSIWPNMDEGTANHKEFKDNKMLLPNSNIYNAYDEKAREIYWKQCSEEWFLAGIDAWWCDSSEPFTAADWCGAIKKTEKQRYIAIMEEAHNSAPWNKTNSYGLWHGRGIYENWKKKYPFKRVVNLSRSTYVSGQKYGIIPWSGDISAQWSVLEKQIVEGLKMCMTGMPYWTQDIGGFFTVYDKWENRGCNLAGDSNKLWFWNGDYNDGVEDLGYCELYTRWLEYGTFLPIFRSHGTDTPREPWNFGKKGNIFYDAIIKFIKLRYSLIPYIYSIAASVSMEHKTMMKSLLFDFKEDKNVWNIKDTYMFGDAFLVSVVTEPMYYGVDSNIYECKKREKMVYLPEGALWYDYWTKEKYQGGNWVKCEAPIEKIPLFVRAGAIIPMSDDINYAGENQGKATTIEIYDGADGTFRLYYDEGDGYQYESGEYFIINIYYSNDKKYLYLKEKEGKLNMQEKLTIRLISDNKEIIKEIFYNGKEIKIDMIG